MSMPQKKTGWREAGLGGYLTTNDDGTIGLALIRWSEEPRSARTTSLGSFRSDDEAGDVAHAFFRSIEQYGLPAHTLDDPSLSRLLRRAIAQTAG